MYSFFGEDERIVSRTGALCFNSGSVALLVCLLYQSFLMSKDHLNLRYSFLSSSVNMETAS
jgi:hypothetical protein